MTEKGPAKKVKVVAIDIGTRLIKIAEVSLEGAAKQLVKFNTAEIPPHATQEEISRSLRTLIESFRPSLKEVNISLSAPFALVRFINMPRMKKEELDNSLRFEAEKYIPFNINEVIIDSVILDGEADDKNQMRILLAAAKRDAVNSRISILKECELIPAVIDIDSFACFNAFCDSSGKNEPASGTGALLNIGYSQTNVIILKDGQPRFMRDIQIGGRDISEPLAKELQLEETGADRVICDPKDKLAQVTEISKAVLSNLVNELRLSFGYYENQHGSSVGQLYVSGGAARLGGISDYFNETLGIKPVIWNPFAKFEIGPDINEEVLSGAYSQFAVCAGLALRAHQ